MSKGKQRPPQYIRQSKGYQQNVYKQQMKEKNIEQPKPIDMKRWTKINRVVMIVWVILIIAGALLINWIAALIATLLGAAYFAGFFFYVDNYSKKVLKVYKTMGIPKEVYLKQIRRGNPSEKEIKRMSKAWDKVKVD